jgi:hypothetical protein
MKRYDLRHAIHTRGTFVCSQARVPYLPIAWCASPSASSPEPSATNSLIRRRSLRRFAILARRRSGGRRGGDEAGPRFDRVRDARRPVAQEASIRWPTCSSSARYS